MNSKELLQTINSAIDDAKSTGQTSVSIDGLKDYLSYLEDDLKDSDREHAIAIEDFKAANDRNIAHANNLAQSENEMFRSVITAGQAALKASLIINGGAALALLALLGKVWTGSEELSIAGDISGALIMFCTGVLYAAMATGGTYLCQFAYAKAWGFVGHALNILTAGFVFASYSMFYTGIHSAASTLAGI
ncbi:MULTISPECIES: hypothetical protein [unclassified Neptuniibacter]|uniref:hypothetical protein n=1 Tax=unclassified Neptuniibacter TaxID=2630693 RepID=UPI000C4E2A62|nr:MULTISPECIES: hypothetical protein [unclassified Neptuniibacter]MAY43523.1 hypothetical protein [Oceanospirillaceae bacterium]|tara:strand:+ start:157 stop:729 length:573 start_codon:yes stop_codon:yes gene_type:complete